MVWLAKGYARNPGILTCVHKKYPKVASYALFQVVKLLVKICVIYRPLTSIAREIVLISTSGGFTKQIRCNSFPRCFVHSGPASLTMPTIEVWDFKNNRRISSPRIAS